MNGGMPMTREVFKTKRMESLAKALRIAENDMVTQTGRNKQANAKMRVNMIQNRMNEYNNNFWDKENTNTYEWLYKNYADDMCVAPY